MSQALTTTDAPSPQPGEGSLLDGGGSGGVTETLLGDASPQAAEAPQTGGGVTGAEGLAPLPDDATEEQRADFRKKLDALNGVPEDAAGYGNFGFGDDVQIDTEREDYKFYTQLFKDAGLSREQARKLIEAHTRYAGEQLQHLQRQQDARITEYRAKVRRDFVKSLGGEEKFREFSDTAVRGFKAAAQGAGLGEKDIRGLLNVMGDDPRFVRLFNNVGRLFREDVLVTGAAARAPEKTFEDMFADMFHRRKGG